MRFIDLFAGLGGFNLALQRLGHTCIFACEIDEGLRDLYKKNFDIYPVGDIRKIVITDIPTHDILCAGFPCQPFSKAGDQQGFNCPKWGDLFDYVVAIVKHHNPQYIMLENVPNLEKHDSGKTWIKMKSDLIKAGYDVQQQKLSPHLFGIPQVRERIFIVGKKASLEYFTWPEKKPNVPSSIMSALDHNPPEAKQLSPQVNKCLDAWQDFLDEFPKSMEIPSFPIWSMEFGATYPYENTTPFMLGSDKLREYKGSHGQSLAGLADEEIMLALPSYARKEEEKFPDWKIRFIQQNRDFYQVHKHWLEKWLPKILEFPSSLQKFEWNCKGEERYIWKFVIQFRASGVRVKRPTTSPSLIAMTDTQVPIIGWEKRYMTPKECAKLQSMHELKQLPDFPTKSFKALGNAVNVSLVEIVARRLLNQNIEEYVAEQEQIVQLALM